MTAVGVAVLGAATLAGWVLDVPALRSVLPGSVTMKANTALGFILCGISLWLMDRSEPESAARRFGQVAAMFAATIGTLTLAEYVFSWDLGIDELLVRDSADAAATSDSGRMAPNTAFCFLVTGAALWALGTPGSGRHRQVFAGVAATLVALTGLLSLAGYLFNVTPGYRWWRLTAMAVHTAGAFLALGVGLFAITRQQSKLTWVVGKGTTSAFAAALTLMIALGAVTYRTTRNMEEAARWVAHTNEVRFHLSELSAAVLNVETGQRGFVLTGMEMFLEPFSTGMNQIPLEIAALRRLTADNSAQESRLVALAPVVAARLDFAQQTIETRRSQGVDASAAMIASGKGQVLMDDIRRRLSELDTEEARLSHLRETESNRVTQMMFLVLPVGLLASMAILLTVLFLLNGAAAEREQALENIRASEVRFHSLVTATSQIVWHTDPDGQVVGSLPAWQAYTGQSDAEIQGAGWAVALHPDDAAHALEVWRKAVEQKTLYDVEYRVRRHDGAYRYFMTRGVPVLNHDGSIREWVGTCTDIHDRKLAELALVEREQAFRQLADAMPQIVWTARPDGRLDYYNQRWFDYTGMTFEQTQGWGWQPVLHPDDLQRCVERWTESFTTGRPYHIEYRFKRASDGAYRWHLGRALPVRDTSGQITGWYGTCTDIHDFKQVEEALRASDERLNTALAASGVGTWSWDIVHNTIVWDDYIHPLFGLQPKTFPGRYEDFLGLLHADDRERITQEVAASVETAAPYDTEYQVVWPDGSVHWLASRGRVFRDATGRPLRMTGVCWDITARKATEADLARLRNQLELILNSVGDGIHGLDTEGKVIFENPASLRMLGWETRELLGRPAHLTMHHTRTDGSAYPVEECHIHATLKDGRVRRVDDEVFWRKDGRSFPVEYVSTAIRDLAGNIMGTVVIFRDITERKRAEEELKRYSGELRRSNQELEHFAYVSSHDLQEPLRTVASFSQLLESRYKDKLDSDAGEFIQFITDGATRMQTLINDLLSYSRIGRRGQTFAPTATEEALRMVLADLDFAIKESHSIVTHDPLPVVVADVVQLRQLLQNLVGNAIKFRKPGQPAQVHISAVRNGGDWHFSVRDNGVGIDPQYFERVFIIFQRLHGREEYAGTGIGLAVCKRIVERHGGRMWVESVPGHGSTFHFTLPEGHESHEIA